MKFTQGFASLALALGFHCLVTGSAEAQAKQAVGNMAVVGASGQLASERGDDADDERARHPMGRAAIGVKVGAVGMGAGKLTFAGQKGQLDPRVGVQVSLPILLGGDGFGWNFEPYFMSSSISHDLKNSTGNVVGSESVSLNAVGMYMGPTFTFQITRPLYLGFGLGIKGAYMPNRDFDYAADLYARVPVHATYYVARRFALTAEIGFGYGASVFADKPVVTTDPITRAVMNTKDDPQFGLAYTWDASIGVRLP
jgi:hypothetical protein